MPVHLLLTHRESRLTSLATWTVILLGLLLIGTLAGTAQTLQKAPLRGLIDPQNQLNQPLTLPVPLGPDGRPLLPPGNNQRDLPATLQVSFDWTLCQVHRMTTNSLIEAILPGQYTASDPQIWTIATLDPQPGGVAQYYFVQGITGQPTPAGPNIPLTWEIAFDGGAYTPMTLQPNNSLTALFPAGTHTFQVRILGTMQAFQDDGYYRLLLSEYFMPQL